MSRFGRKGGGLDPALLPALESFVPGLRRRLASNAALAFLAGLAEAGMLLVLTGLADGTIKGADRVELGPISAGSGAAAAIGIGFLVVRILLAVSASWLGVNLGVLALQRAREALVAAFLDADAAEVSGLRVGELQERMTTSCDRVASATESVVAVVAATLGFSSLLLVAAAVDPVAFALILAAAAALAFGLRPVSRYVRRLAGESAAAAFAFGSSISETALATTELAAFGVGGRRAEALSSESAVAVGARRRARLATMILPTAYQAVSIGSLFVVLLVLSGRGDDDAAKLGAIVLLLLRSFSAGQQILTYRGQLIDHAPYVTSVRDEIDRLRLVRTAPGSVDVGRIRALHFEHVDFSYGEGWQLEDVDLTVAAGESLAVVGPSGSGKSTFVRLLLRQRRATNGRVAVDGLDLLEVTPSSWATATGYVPQAPLLIRGSVRENVAFLRDVPDDAVREACRRAHVLDEIEALPQGFDTPVDVFGGALSGGQRQRLALARALAGGPQLLVLDEPTSALDVVSEQRIAEALQELHGEVTVVIVAHRPATLVHCDRVLVLSEGKVEAVGGRDEATRASPYFRRMLDLEAAS